VLFDKLAISAKEASETERKEMYKLALSIVLTSQGISFLHAGTEFMRSKKGVENSFESPDSINAIDWGLKTKNRTEFDFIKGLIKMRKEHPLFRMTTAKQIAANIRFKENQPQGIIVYEIDGKVVNDKWEKVQVMLNGTNKAQPVTLDSKLWQRIVADNKISDEKNVLVSVELAPYSCTILIKDSKGLKN
jgi:pullulanase